MEIGVVHWYDGRDGKLFGFINIRGGRKQIFFHRNDGRNYEIVSGDKNILFFQKPLEKEPRQSNHIAFECTPGSQGRPKASPWYFIGDYEKMKKQILDLTGSHTYRVLEQRTFNNGTPHEPETLWEGPDLLELCSIYQRPNDPEKDFLCPVFCLTNFERKIWFERKTDSGVWKCCDDPRPIGP